MQGNGLRFFDIDNHQTLASGCDIGVGAGNLGRMERLGPDDLHGARRVPLDAASEDGLAVYVSGHVP